MRAVVISCVLAAAALARADAPLDRWLDRAEASLQRERLESARRALRRAERIAPTDPRVTLLAARLLPYGDERDALWVIALSEDDATEDAVVVQALSRARARALLITGRPRDAFDALAPTIGRQDAAAAEVLRRIGADAWRAGSPHLAERALKLARRVMPQDPAIGLDLAALLVARGEPRAAIAIYLEIVRAHPEDAYARRALAGALLAEGRGDDALAELRWLADRGGAGERLDVAQAALESGQADVAFREARLAQSAGAPREATLRIVGIAAARTGRDAEARVALRQLLELRPGDARAQALLDSLAEP